MPLSSKISAFRNKARLWDHFKKKSFFVHKSVYINSLRKISLFCDNLDKTFVVHKYPHFEEKFVFWDHFEKIVLYPISENIKIQGINFFEKINFCAYVQKYYTSRKIALFWVHLKNILFWPYLRKYQHFGIKHRNIIWKKSVFFLSL